MGPASVATLQITHRQHIAPELVRSDTEPRVAYVDCKTDLAAQMRTRFPDHPGNEGRRALEFALTDKSDDDDALWQLAHLTFTYHRAKRGSAC